MSDLLQHQIEVHVEALAEAKLWIKQHLQALFTQKNKRGRI
jgi:hypothetical protein